MMPPLFGRSTADKMSWNGKSFTARCAIVGVGYVLLSFPAIIEAGDHSEQREDGQDARRPHHRRRLDSINATNVTAATAVANLVDSSVVTRNATRYGFSTCLGNFVVDEDDGKDVWPNASYPRAGIILSTGAVDSIEGPNDADGTTTDDLPDDQTFDPNPIFPHEDESYYHSCTLEFEFLCNGSSGNDYVTFSYVFASDEYLEYIEELEADQISDKFRFLLNDVDMALTPQGDLVEINTINDVSNSDLFNDNEADDDAVEPDEPRYNIQADGFTTVLTATGQCNTTLNNGWNKIRLAIADEDDPDFDSWVLLKAASFVVGSAPSSQPSDTPSVTPSTFPSDNPSSQPSDMPSVTPTTSPSDDPSPNPSAAPTLLPSSNPSLAPSPEPSRTPSGSPSSMPSSEPSDRPTFTPSFVPSFAPTPVSTGTLTLRRTPPPSTMPSSEPTPDGDVGAGQPTLQPQTIEVDGRRIVCQCPPDEE